jgi:hypothetical protein
MKTNKSFFDMLLDVFFNIFEHFETAFKNANVYRLDFFRGVKNLKYWFKVIWNDRYWDSYYLFVILCHKLSDMEKNFRKNQITASSEEDADNIKICIDALKRLMEDEHEEISSKEHDEKWGELITTIDETTGQWNFTRKNIKTQQDKQQETTEHDNYMKKAEEQRQDDLNLICDTIKKKSFGWWD